MGIFYKIHVGIEPTPLEKPVLSPEMIDTPAVSDSSEAMQGASCVGFNRGNAGGTGCVEFIRDEAGGTSCLGFIRGYNPSMGCPYH